MKKYETPELYVDEFAADTMIASSQTNPKNGNANNNQNCWGCDMSAGGSGNGGENACVYDPDTNPALYQYYCT